MGVEAAFAPVFRRAVVSLGASEGTASAIVQRIRSFSGAAVLDKPLDAAITMGRRLAVEAEKAGKKLSESDIAELVKTHTSGEAFTKLTDSVAQKGNGSLGSIAGGGIVAGLAVGAVTLALKPAVFVFDKLVQLATLNRIKLNWHKSISITGAAKTAAMLGLGGMTILAGRSFIKAASVNSKRTEALREAFKEGLSTAAGHTPELSSVTRPAPGPLQETKATATAQTQAPAPAPIQPVSKKPTAAEMDIKFQQTMKNIEDKTATYEALAARQATREELAPKPKAADKKAAFAMADMVATLTKPAAVTDGQHVDPAVSVAAANLSKKDVGLQKQEEATR